MSDQNQSVPRSAERVGDYVAITLLAAGVALFAFGRRSLTDIAQGRHPAPIGQSWVSLAERYDAQTRWGLWIAGIGLAVGLLSSLRYVWRRARARRSVSA